MLVVWARRASLLYLIALAALTCHSLNEMKKHAPANLPLAAAKDSRLGWGAPLLSIPNRVNKICIISRTDQSTNRSIHEPINPRTDQSTNRSIHEPINPRTDQSTNRIDPRTESIHEPNRSTNRIDPRTESIHEPNRSTNRIDPRTIDPRTESIL